MDDDTTTEKRLIETVMTMAEAMPLDVPCAVLAQELIATMGEDRDDQKKLVMMAVTLSAAFKVIARSQGGSQSDPLPTKKERK